MGVTFSSHDMGSATLVQFRENGRKQHNLAKALGVNVDFKHASDPKPSAIIFVKQNVHTEHHFVAINDQTVGEGWCELHGRKCRTDTRQQTDLCVVGFPCAPYSSVRPKRGQTRSLSSKGMTGPGRYHSDDGRF